jgi:hypothetical protein
VAQMVRFAIVILLAACASSPATPTPGSSATAAPTDSGLVPTASASQSPTTESPTPVGPTPSAASPTPSSQPSATGELPDTLAIKWVNPPGASGLADLAEIRGSARQGNRFVIVGTHNSGNVDEPDRTPAIWWSDNATTWHSAALPAGYETTGCCVTGAAAGGPGFVAVGDGPPLWSTDGLTWTQGTAPGLVATSRLISVGASPTGLIAVGFDDADKSIAFESGDGKTWTEAPATAQLLDSSEVLFANAGADLLGFAIQPTAGAGQTVVWHMQGIGVWQQLGTIDGAVQTAAYGAKGWLAVGDGAAWLSAHGVNWTLAPTAPKGYADAAVVDASGFVVVSEIIPPGCAIDESQIVGQTWTSVDGSDWLKMKLDWTGRWLNALFTLDRTLVGVGQSHETTEFGFVRTAQLPGGTLAAGAPPTPEPTATPNEGCG